MATNDSTAGSTTPTTAEENLINATDKLDEAAALAEFIQSISLNGAPGALTLQPGQLHGFYFAMKNMIGRINEAEALIITAMEQSKALSA